MSLMLPDDTLAFHRSRALSSYRDMSGVPAGSVAKAVKAFMAADKAPGTVPETEALWFYLLNHGMAELQKRHAPLEPLNETMKAYASGYYENLNEKAVRAFYYLLLICTRESRHVQKSEWFGSKLMAFDEACYKFNQMLGHGSDTAYKQFLNHPPNATIGTYCKSLQFIFYKGKFGGGFGGPKWGKVSDCLVNFVEGKYTAEMMLDTVWTLSHNNGPIFNKGMLYTSYSSKLQRILDVQRSGQIPEMVLYDSSIYMFASATMKGVATLIRNEFPGAVGGDLDWDKVHALGAVAKYPKGEASDLNPLFTPKPKKILWGKPEPAFKPVPEVVPVKVPTMETHFEVMPGVLLEKFKPARMKATEVKPAEIEDAL